MYGDTVVWSRSAARWVKSSHGIVFAKSIRGGIVVGSLDPAMVDPTDW